MKRVAAAVFAVALGFTLITQAWNFCAAIENTSSASEKPQTKAPQVFDKDMPGWDNFMSKGLTHKFNRRALGKEIYIAGIIDLDLIWRDGECFYCDDRPLASDELIASMEAEEAKAIQEEAEQDENAFSIQFIGWDDFEAWKTNRILAKWSKDLYFDEGSPQWQLGNDQFPMMQHTTGDPRIDGPFFNVAPEINCLGAVRQTNRK